MLGLRRFKQALQFMPWIYLRADAVLHLEGQWGSLPILERDVRPPLATPAEKGAASRTAPRSAASDLQSAVAAHELRVPRCQERFAEELGLPGIGS